MSKCADKQSWQSSVVYKTAAIVVLYFPDENVYENILSYLTQVDLVVLVDNSDKPATDLIEKFSKYSTVISIVNGCNLGIASALNIGVREAIAQGCDFVLTMDQDSCALPNMVEILLKDFDSVGGNRVAIVSPFHLTTVVEPPDLAQPPYVEVDTVWTSGNILKLTAYQDVGQFDEALFIDFVDHEYCLRLKRNGYMVIQSNRAILRHNIGNNLKKIDFMAASLVVSNHSPLRRYYITRNRFWVTNRYREFKRFCWIDKRRFFAEILTIVLFEKQKTAKLRMLVRGYQDYRRGKMGKFEARAMQRSGD